MRGMPTSTRVALCIAAIGLAALCSAGCAVARKAGAGAALPFAATGDSVLLPFQGIGRASSKLMSLGDEHLAYVREKNKGKVTIPLVELTAGCYYIPGAVLWPFDAATPSTLYPMTKSCMAVFDEPVTRTNKPPRSSGGPQGQFKEW